MEQARDGVVLYWRPMCTYCLKLWVKLRFARLPYRAVNIWRDPDAAAFVGRSPTATRRCRR